jgi:AraC-like DNA-binding protein
MQQVIDTRDYPPDERLGRWNESLCNELAPMTNSVSDADSFRGAMWSMPLGPSSVATVETSPLRSCRTQAQIRAYDPELLILAMCECGTGTITQRRMDTSLHPYEMTCYSTGRPFEAVALADGPRPVRATVATVPRALLPMRPNTLDRALVTLLPSDGSLLYRFLRGLTAQGARYDGADGARLGNVLVDLLCVDLTQAAGGNERVPHDMSERVRLRQAKTFISQHLADPELAPSTVAAALHVSVRSLHRLFQHEESGVAEWIREQRLERYRRCLVDPASAELSLHSLATRCGLGGRAQFRLFRTAYGMSPDEYRRFHAQRGTALRTPGAE